MTQSRNKPDNFELYETKTKTKKKVCNEYLRYCSINKFRAVGTPSCTFHDNTLSMRQFSLFFSFVRSLVRLLYSVPLKTLIISIVSGKHVSCVQHQYFIYSINTRCGTIFSSSFSFVAIKINIHRKS